MRYLLALVLAGCCEPAPEYHWHKIDGYWYLFDRNGDQVDPITHKNSAEK